MNQLKRFLSDIRNRFKTNEQIFSNVYKKKYWGEVEGSSFFSGEGTYISHIDSYNDIIIDAIKKFDIKSVCEIGCGDFEVSKKVLKSVDVDYIGIDVVPELIQHLSQKYGDNSTKFICLDAAKENCELPKFELCIIRQVLQHLSNKDILRVLQNVRQFPYVIITEHLPINPQEFNGDKVTNGYIRLQNKLISGVYIDKSPFNLTSPTELLRIRLDDKDYQGNKVDAELVTFLIAN
jgi:hypothetical protein